MVVSVIVGAGGPAASGDGLGGAGDAGRDVASGSLDVLRRERGRSGLGWAWRSWLRGTLQPPVRVQLWHGVGWREDMGRAGTARASSSHQTYASPSKRVGVLAGGVAGVGSSTAALQSPVFVGGMNMPETLKSTSG